MQLSQTRLILHRNPFCPLPWYIGGGLGWGRFASRPAKPVLLLAVLASFAFAPLSPADPPPDNPPPAPAGLDSLHDDALYGELADRGLDDLLKRAMQTDNVPPAQQASIWTLASMRRLQNDKTLSESQRQAILHQLIASVDQTLATLGNDPELIMSEAKVIAEQGVDPQTGLLEYWGGTAAQRARLRPAAEAAVRMFDAAATTASAQATDLANRITSPDDKLAEQWKKMSDVASEAAYQKARLQCALALSMDPNDPRLQNTITDAIKSLATWDNADSGIQPQVHLLLAKLHVLTGDRDEIEVAQGLLADFTRANVSDAMSPAPSRELVFEAICYRVIASLSESDISRAQTAMKAAQDYQAANFPNDRQQQAALRLLNYRLLAREADEAPDGPQKDAANTAAVTALTGLIHDFPNLRDAIYHQLAARLPANPDLSSLDPTLLLAVVDQGREAVAGATPDHPADRNQLLQSVNAAREVLKRQQDGSLAAAEAVEPSFLLGIFEEALGDKPAAVDALLDHIALFGSDPQSHADVALDRARAIISELRQATPPDPQVQRLEDRFLPMAINPPFKQEEFALQYAANLFSEQKWADAVKYYEMVPSSEPPRLMLVARYGEMVAFKNQLEQTHGLKPEQKNEYIAGIQKLADQVGTLAHQIIDSNASDEDKQRAKSTLSRMSLIAADITRRDQNDPQRVLQLLDGFESSVQGLPDAKSLTSGALFLRVQAYMQLGRNDDATQTLVKYLSTSTPDEGAQTVHDLLATLNKDLDSARAERDAAAQRQDDAAEQKANADIRTLADNRAMLSGFLVKWAQSSGDPKIRAYAYTYQRFDADTKRLAAELETDPTARKRDLTAALALYRDLQSPENVERYQASITPESGIDKDYPDPLVSLGIGVISYDLEDCQTVKDTLGPLIQDEKLGQNNDQFWQASYELLDCLHTLAKSGDASTSDAQVAQSLKVLYLIWRDGTGGPHYHEKFEALRKEVIPDWKLPQN
jgi:hypothetical protein